MAGREAGSVKRERLIVVFVTCGSAQEARKLARAVLEAKLAACVNIIPRVESHFWWQGKIDNAAEFLLVMKSAHRHLRELTAVVRKTHSYDTPEIVAISVADVEKRYAKWWRDSMG